MIKSIVPTSLYTSTVNTLQQQCNIPQDKQTCSAKNSVALSSTQIGASVIFVVGAIGVTFWMKKRRIQKEKEIGLLYTTFKN